MSDQLWSNKRIDEKADWYCDIYRTILIEDVIKIRDDLELRITEQAAELSEAFHLAQTLVKRTEEQAAEIARLRDEITTLERALSVSDEHVAEIVLANQ